jgi:hypothetical protein
MIALAGHALRRHPPRMVVVSEAEAAAIRTAFERGGELSAAVELRRLFPGITSTTQARECARTIAGWSRCQRRCAVSDGCAPARGVRGGRSSDRKSVSAFCIAGGAKLPGVRS